MRLAWIAVALFGCASVGVSCGSDGRASSRFDEERAMRDLEAQVRIGARHSGTRGARRTAALIGRRLRAARVRGVRTQRPHRNVVARIPGRRRGAIVVGAHYDTKDDVGPGFQGANDGASGVAVVLELARTLPRPFPGPSVHLALFDAEETRGERDFRRDGTRGSRQYVRYAARKRRRHGAPALRSIRAMVLFDMVGDCDLQIPYEPNSSRRLYDLFEGDAFSGTSAAVLDDHIPFRRRGIPAVDLIDFDFGPGNSYWHTPQDTLDKVCPESLGAVGRAALAALPRIG